jgi:phosphoesterase RecJ-like protein
MRKMVRQEQEERAKILRTLEGDGPFVIAFHPKPDGDALGSALALARWLGDRGAEAVVVSRDGASAPYGFLSGARSIVPSAPENISGHVAIIVDAPDAERTDLEPHVLSRATTVVNIDHHPDNTFVADQSLVDPHASSAALLVLELLESAGGVTTEIAELLYVGLLADTGAFQFANTDARTLEAAARLVWLGARPAQLAEAIYGRQPLGQVRLLGMVLASAETHIDGKVVLFILTEEMRGQAGSSGEAIEGLAAYGRRVAGVEVAVLLREQADHIRVSLRSKGAVDVNAAARQLGGGGHAAAAGIHFEGTLAEAREAVIAALETHMKQGE